MQKQSFAYILGWSQEKIAGWYVQTVTTKFTLTSWLNNHTCNPHACYKEGVCTVSDKVIMAAHAHL